LATLRPEDVGLTDKGWKQAKAIAHFLREAQFHPDFVITSSYLRTKQTAAPTTLALPSVLEEEQPVHEFTYLSAWLEKFATVDDRRPYVDAYWQISDPEYNDGPGAESFNQFINRVRDFKTRLEATELDTMAVFTHEQFISAFLWLLKKGEVTPTSKEMSEFRAFLFANPIPNGAIVQMKFHRVYDEWRSEMITSHLRSEELRPALSAR
jgi:broad specificity phosphatase PhoE